MDKKNEYIEQALNKDTCLNVLLSALSELSQTNALLMELVGMKYASMPPAAKSQYEMLKKREEVTDHAGKRE